VKKSAALSTHMSPLDKLVASPSRRTPALLEEIPALSPLDELAETERQEHSNGQTPNNDNIDGYWC